jgi:hypothetical protein
MKAIHLLQKEKQSNIQQLHKFQDIQKLTSVTLNMSRDGSGSTVSDYGLDVQGSIPDRGRGFFF